MDVGAACTGFLSGACSSPPRQVEGGRARQRARDRRRRAEPLHRPRPTAAPPPCSPTAPARRVVAPAEDGGGRIGEIVLRCDGSGAHSITRRRTTSSIIHMQGHDTFKAAVQRMSEASRRGGRAAPASSSTTSTCSSTTRRTRASSPRWASGSASTSARVVNSIDRYGNTSRRHAPDRPRRRSRARNARARHERAARRVRRGLHVGRGRDRMGGMNGRPDGSALVTGSITRDRRGDRQGARAGGLAGGRELPQRRRGGERRGRGDHQGRRPREGAQGRRRRPRAPPTRSSARSRRSSAPCSCS